MIDVGRMSISQKPPEAGSTGLRDWAVRDVLLAAATVGFL
jgi:hypothetical protein